MTVDEKRVVRLIRNAFQGVVLGNGTGLREADGIDDYADAKTLATYREEDEHCDWSKISIKDLNRYYSSLAFFDPEGMRFHLPAFLIADLRRKFDKGVVFVLTYSGQNACERFSLLTDVQRDAVREFLQLKLADPVQEFSRPMIEQALEGYWAPAEDPAK